MPADIPGPSQSSPRGEGILFTEHQQSALYILSRLILLTICHFVGEEILAQGGKETHLRSHSGHGAETGAQSPVLNLGTASVLQAQEVCRGSNTPDTPSVPGPLPPPFHTLPPRSMATVLRPHQYHTGDQHPVSSSGNVKNKESDLFQDSQ